MTRPGTVTVRARIERKQDGLPRFVVVPAKAIAPWGLEATTVLDVSIDGSPSDRRTIKRWDEARWFVTVTEADCKRLGVDTGDAVTLALGVAEEEDPPELAALLRSSPRAASAWKGITPAGRRMIRENVAAAKKPETRANRARKALLGE